MFCVAAATLVPELITLCFAARAATVGFALRALTVFGATVVALRELTDAGLVAERAADVRAARAATVVLVCVLLGCDAVPRAPPRAAVAPYASIPPIKNANINSIFFNGIPPIIFIILSQKYGDTKHKNKKNMRGFYPAY